MKIDKYGNIKCLKCRNFYSPSLTNCPDCCKHEKLDLTEEWTDSDGYKLDVICTTCGRDYGFDNEWIINNFKLVRK